MSIAYTALPTLLQYRSVYEGVLDRLGAELPEAARLSELVHRKMACEALWSAVRAYDRGRAEEIPVDELVSVRVRLLARRRADDRLPSVPGAPRDRPARARGSCNRSCFPGSSAARWPCAGRSGAGASGATRCGGCRGRDGGVNEGPVVTEGATGVQEHAETDQGLGARAASGLLWVAAQKWVVRATGLVTLAFLTRRVSPQEFGVLAAAMTVIPLVYLVADLGLSTYLLQSDEVDERTLSTAFWASAGLGALLSGALVGAAPLLARAFHSPELATVLRSLVVAVVPTVLAGVPLALLRRALAFKQVALQGLVAAFLAQAAAILVAVAGGGVWALVAQLAVTQWVIGLLAWRSARWRPSLHVSWRQFRDMIAFGVRVSAVDVVATVRNLAEAWIVAVSLGAPALGLLNIGQRVVQVAQDLTAASLVPVSTVVFAKVGTLQSAFVAATSRHWASPTPSWHLS